MRPEDVLEFFVDYEDEVGGEMVTFTREFDNRADAESFAREADGIAYRKHGIEVHSAPGAPGFMIGYQPVRLT